MSSVKSVATRYAYIHDVNAPFTGTDELTAALSAARNLLYSTPANPAGTSSTTGVMMGLAILYTPKSTGRVKVTLAGLLANNTAGDGATANLQYGTGAAPANGAAPAGTAAGNVVTETSPAAGQTNAVVLQAVISGLTVGTQYWLDVLLAAVTGGTASISNIAVTIEEL
jgi:hypothetical protein